MLLPLLIGAALAAPPDYKQTKTTDACTLYLGPAESGVSPMRAECHWPEITLDKMDGLMSAVGDHDLYFSSVETSNVVRTDGGRTLVYQVHKAKGISDREANLWMTRSEAGGTITVAWSLAPDVPIEAQKGNVAVGRSDGHWEFSAHPDGGVLAVHQLSYDPGGSVPGFVVRWFQTSGLTAVVTELRAYATSH